MPIMIPDPGSVGAGQANIARSVGTPRNVDVGVRSVPQNTAYASPDAFGAGVGAGLRSLGKGIEAVGGDLMSIANDIKEQQATAALMDQEAILEEHRAEYYNKVATGELGPYAAGPDSFREHMDRARKVIQQRVSEIPATKLPGVSRKLNQNFEQYVAINSTRAARDAVLLQIKDGRQRALNAREQAIRYGDWERAESISMSLPGTLPADREAMAQDVRFRMQDNALAVAMDADPRGVAQRLDEDENFMPEVQGAARVEARRRAEMLSNQRSAETARDWSVRLSNGDYPTEQEIDTAVELGDISEERAEEFKKVYKEAYPDEQTSRAFLELEGAIANYDPSKDPTKSQLAQLRQRIFGFGPTQQGYLSDLLTRDESSFRSSNNYRYGSRLINNEISSSGQFYQNATGEDAMPENVLAPEWEEIRNMAFDALERKMQTAEGRDMDEREVHEFIQGVLSAPMAKQALQKIRETEASIRGGGATSALFPKDSFTPRESTAYWPGPKSEAKKYGLSGTMEGGEKDAHGNKIWGNTTYEDYLAGKGDYVTIAMDKNSPEFRNKAYMTSPDFPGVLFRVMDTGSYGNGRGRGWVDIAFRDPRKAKMFKSENVRFNVISDEVAERLKRNGGSE